MNIRSGSLFSRPRAAAIALAAALVSLGAPCAQAQLFNWDSALPPTQIERMIQASGYRLTGPVIRRGPVYLANVLGRDNDPERLIIDAKEGRLLQRFPAAGRRQPLVSDGWSSQPPQTGSLFGWLTGGDDDAVAPRPPAGLDGEAPSEPLRAAPVAPIHAPAIKEVARADDAASPYVIPAPNGAPAAIHAPLLEKPRLRPQAKHKKPETTPVVALPASAPTDGKPAPVAQPAAVPSAATPTKSDASGEPAAPAPRVADTKFAPALAPTPAAVAPSAPPPKAPAAKPALNDVPVAPLE
jgi:hypothetical protein